MGVAAEESGEIVGLYILHLSVAAVIAVVCTNKPALALYEKLGFVKLGVIPKGFLMKDGTYEDIIPHYIEL